MRMHDEATRGRRIAIALAGLALGGCENGGGTGSAGVGPWSVLSAASRAT